MKKIRKIILLTFSLLILSCSNNTPEKSLVKIKEAYENKDYSKISELIDIDDLINDIIDDKQKGHEVVAKGISELMREKQVAKHKRELKKLFETSDFKEWYHLGLYLPEFSFSNISTSNQGDSKVKNAAIGININGLDQQLKLTLQMREKKGYWQVFNVFNSIQLLNKSFDSLLEVKENYLNKIIIDTILSKNIKFENISFKSYGWRTIVKFELKNLSKHTIVLNSLSIDFVAQNNNSVLEFEKSGYSDPVVILPNKSITLRNNHYENKESNNIYSTKNFMIKDFSLVIDTTKINSINGWDAINFQLSEIEKMNNNLNRKQ